MSSSETFFWHDYETFGADPSYDRPVQFAGLRTDLDLNPVGEPLTLYARPPRDYLPQPQACLITGITPQLAEERGVSESEFIDRVLSEFMVPGTCAVGYNSLRFDDTVTRFTAYRNLLDPYAREYGDGRSRWDLIDAMRTAYALRPEGIEWPRRDDGLASFRLEDLCAANGIEHGQAHDALADVRATIGLARLLRARQPKLYEWLFRHRFKQSAQKQLDPGAGEPLLHVSGMFGAARANLGLILPLAAHPQNRNEVICADLSVDAALLLELSEEELQRRLYAKAEDLAPDEPRPGLKSVHANRCPVLLPAKMAEPAVAERAGLDLATCRANLVMLRDAERSSPGALRDKLHRLSALSKQRRESDPDRMLYSGGFLPREDRSTLDRLLQLSPDELAEAHVAFDDPRLEEMLFRYRARNFPNTLSPEERERWEEFRFAQITEGDGRALTLDGFNEQIEALLEDTTLSARDRDILEALQQWGDGLLAGTVP